MQLGDAALYGTIWLAMLLFAAGESARSFTQRGVAPPSWAWWTFTLGLVFALIHTLLAFAIVHGWSHEDAVRATASQTAAVYGFPFGAGVYVNYLFLLTWLADAWWWRAAPRRYVRPLSVVWTLRAFYFVIIFNAAVVFAAGLRRVFGLLLVSWMIRAWTARITTPVPASPRTRSPEDRTAFR